MTTIPISLPLNPYNVYLEEHLLEHFSSYINSIDDIVIITDSGIPKSYVETVKHQLNEPLIFTIPVLSTKRNIAVKTNDHLREDTITRHSLFCGIFTIDK